MPGPKPWFPGSYDAKFSLNAGFGLGVPGRSFKGMLMRLTLSAVLCAALLTSPALAHDRHRDHREGPPPGADFPPPPPGYGPYGSPIDPRWEHDQRRFHDEWQARCGDHGGDRHGDDRDDPHGCGYPAPYGYPGAYMTYGVPVIMVSVLRNKPCKEVVEEVVEEVAVPTRRRIIRPRARIVPDKRIRIVPDKRVPITPSKRIAY
jgi:hypothetical protein